MRSMQLQIIVYSVSLICGLVSCIANLKYYETFSHIMVTSKVKRSHGTQEPFKEVKFKAFARDFHLILKTGTDVLADDFSAELVDGVGETTPIFFDGSNLYTGYLKDDSDVLVNAFMVHHLWSIQIFDKNDTYIIEPAENLLNASEKPVNDTMIAYRGTDLNFDGLKCGVRPSEKHQDSPYRSEDSKDEEEEGFHDNQSRKPRQLFIEPKACVIHLTADYAFYSRRCNKSPLSCTSMLISFITLANNIYGNTDFLDSTARVHKLNVLAGRIKIFTAYTKSTNPDDPHFNDISDWTSETKLDSFALAMSYRDKEYCHSHLFTSYGMANRILGLAWVSGVCAIQAPGRKLFSCGVSTGEDKVVGHVPSLQLSLVFVHGHSLGARHDSDIAECAPSEAYGGRFIMWDQSVMGDEPNHKVFSKCSVLEIGRTLETASCLKEKVSVPPLCGNGVLDKGEECDAGAFGLVGIDKCCKRDCKLLPGNICSDLNVNCCFNCQTAPNTTTCGHSPVRDCKGNSYCSGNAYECLPPVNKPDAESCWDGGECLSGVCKHFCDKQGLLTGSVLKSCMCRIPIYDACKWCCFNITDPKDVGPCIPYSDNYVYDGRPCFAGYCKAGTCIAVQRSFRSVYAYITSIRTSELVKFMRTNIVLTVIVICTMLWIPSIIAINFFDEEERKSFDQLDHGYLMNLSGSDHSVNSEEIEMQLFPTGAREDDPNTDFNPDRSQVDRGIFMFQLAENIRKESTEGKLPLQAVNVKNLQGIDENKNERIDDNGSDVDPIVSAIDCSVMPTVQFHFFPSVE